jgi:hypothetical protein
MRVAWVQDNSRPWGGAENSNRCVVSVGESLGFDIVGITPQNFHPRVLADCDVVIINNFFQFAAAQERLILETIRGGKPYVKYEHDSRELGRPKVSERLFGDSALNVFLSPAHLQNHRCHLGCDGIALPLAINTEMFKPVPGVERRENRALFVGGWIKGGKIAESVHRYVAERPELEYVSVGHRINERVKVIPMQDLSKMPALYSSVGCLVHLPDMICAGERVVFEAALCGVKKIVMNDNVGHKSWNRDLSDTDGLRAWLKKAPYDFWKAVEVAANGKVAA